MRIGPALLRPSRGSWVAGETRFAGGKIRPGRMGRLRIMSSNRPSHEVRLRRRPLFSHPNSNSED